MWLKISPPASAWVTIDIRQSNLRVRQRRDGPVSPARATAERRCAALVGEGRKCCRPRALNLRTPTLKSENASRTTPGLDSILPPKQFRARSGKRAFQKTVRLLPSVLSRAAWAAHVPCGPRPVCLARPELKDAPVLPINSRVF